MMKIFQIGLFICTAVSWTDYCKSFKSITEEGQQSLAILEKKGGIKKQACDSHAYLSNIFIVSFLTQKCTLAVAKSWHFGFKISMTNFLCKCHWAFMYLSFVMSWLSNCFFLKIKHFQMMNSWDLIFDPVTIVELILFCTHTIITMLAKQENKISVAK